MNLRDIISDELPKHSPKRLLKPTFPHDIEQDSGGLTCLCGEWEHGPDFSRYTDYRPYAEYTVHVADSIQRAITTDSLTETLTAVNARITTQRLGKSITREMDSDILVLRQAAKTLIDLIGDDHE